MAHGYVGNRAAVFPLQRMGFEVIAVNTVQFSNHTGYGSWRGEVFSAEHIQEILDGIYERGIKIDALLSGYLGAPDIGEAALYAMDRFDIRTWLCDPVMGDIDRGFFVREGIPDFFKSKALKRAGIITPNLFELRALTQLPIETKDEAIAACRSLHKQNSTLETILVTSLEFAIQQEYNQISMLLSHKDGAIWVISTPKIDFPIPPNGAGDLTAAIFLGQILNQKPLYEALENTAASVYSVLAQTHAIERRELDLIGAQDHFTAPDSRFKAAAVESP